VAYELGHRNWINLSLGAAIVIGVALVIYMARKLD